MREETEELARDKLHSSPFITQVLIRIEISIFREQNQHEATYLNAELLLLPSNIRGIGIYVLEFKFHQPYV